MTAMMRTASVSFLLLGAVTAGCAAFGGGGGGGQDQNQQDGNQQTNQNASAGDPTQYINVLDHLMISPAARVGYLAEMTISSTSGTLVESYAIVGESGDSFRIESPRHPSVDALAASFPELKDQIIGWTVRKSDGLVTRAVVGRPGETGKEVKLIQVPQSATVPQGVAERVSIGIGTFDATKTVAGDTTTWVGSSGDTQYILLKLMSPSATYELAEMPTKSTKDVGGVSVQVTETSYTNGMKMGTTDNEVIAALFFGGLTSDGRRLGRFRHEQSGTTSEITAVKTDATPQLKWE
jgi:hypothetical protein